MQRLIILIVSTCFSVQAQAFPCFLTAMKDNCWSDYNVTLDVFDATNNAQLITVIIPQGSSWGRQPFTCQPNQKLRFQAQFTPVFWENDVGKVYSALNFRTLPNKVGPGDTAWNIAVCYPEEFAEVPLPPEAGSNCKCDVSGIPAIKPQ